MLARAILCIPSSQDQFIGIPVANFPALPVGSAVYIYITDDVYFEDARIEEYEASNRYGTQVKLSIHSEEMLSSAPGEILDEMWNRLALLCQKDVNMLCDFIYPEVLNFGVPYLPADQPVRSPA